MAKRKTKQNEIRRLGYGYIKEIDIWNYLKDTNWKSRINLELHEMVDDIMHLDEVAMEEYLKRNKGNINKQEEV